MIEHSPVLLGPALEALRPRPGGVYLDATVGLGGHSAEILRRSGPDGILFGLDRDERALAEAHSRLAEFGERARLFHGNYADFGKVLPFFENAFDGVLADLGVSSLQLNDPGRGFSFQREGPLDMRMDSSEGETALAFLARATPAELEARLREAGEDRFARRLVPAMLEGARTWRTTRDLAAGVERILPRRGRSHPATRVFLALRMAVNRELEGLRTFLEKVPPALKPEGRLVVISFHSSEDRIVKRFYSDVWKVMEEMSRVTKSPVVPDAAERRENPRSRSAKMRVFEKRRA